MKKRNILRVFGVIFSILIIASVFLPYSKVDNLPLFTSVKASELVLPIILIIFGLASLLLYALNSYCEFTLSTGGAALFFVIIEAIYAVGNKTINEFGLGYYVLALGATLLFINSVLILFTKKEKKEVIEQPRPVYEQPIQTVIEQNPVMEPAQPVVEPVVLQPVVTVEEPVIPQTVVAPVVEPVQTVTPVEEPVQMVTPVAPVVELPVEPVVSQPVVEPVAPVQTVTPVEEPVQELKPIVDTYKQGVVSESLPEIQFDQIPETKEPIKPIYEEPLTVKPEENPALRSFFEPSAPSTPVAEPVQPTYSATQSGSVNPVLDQFDKPLSFLGPVEQQNSQVEQTQNNNIDMSIFNNH